VCRHAAFALLIGLLALLSAGCGGTKGQAPGAVVDSWSQAINGGDDEAAAKLFARDAVVIQDGQRLTLATEADALAFNASLPCGAKVVGKKTSGDEVTTTFTLTRRPGHMCDGTGEAAVTVFQVADGKITLWHELPSGAAETQSA
jgi:hypothetical protein